MRVVVSFLGTGRLKKDEQGVYEETVYVFPDGEEFKTPLATAPIVKKLSPQKLIFIGTPKSMWPSLDELLRLEGLEVKREDLHTKVFDETLSDEGVKTDTLKEWERYLSEELPYEITLGMVKDEKDLQKIVELLYYEIPKGAREVYLEITHAFRHFPLIASFTMPILRLLKDIGKISFIYGLFGGNKSKIMFFEEVNELIELLEALALSEYGGNFSKLSQVFGGMKEIEELYIKTETNRKISTSYLNRLVKDMPEETIYQRIAKEHIISEVIESLKGDRLPLRMANKAMFFAQKDQFLKAYTLIYEAIIGCFLDRESYEQAGYNEKQMIYNEAKTKVKDFLKDKEDLMEIWRKIQSIRNAIAHGSSLGKEENLLLDRDTLRKYVFEGKRIVETVLKTSD